MTARLLLLDIFILDSKMAKVKYLTPKSNPIFCVVRPLIPEIEAQASFVA